MRDLKLRAWNTQEKKMLYRNLFDMNWYETEKNDAEGCHCWGSITGGQRNFLEVMLSTGLRDKNGKVIYENDILKDDIGVIEQVQWVQDSFVWRGIIGLSNDAYRCEIIGNIYENPELLKSKMQ